jgi:hypothetical protein
MTKAVQPTPSILIRDIDPALAELFRERCRMEGRVQRRVLIDLIAYYTDHGLPIASKARK